MLEILRLRLFYLLLCVSLAAACTADREAVESAAPESTTKVAEIGIYAENADTAEPAIAAGEGGIVHVAYVEHRADKTADIYIQAVSPDMKLSGPRVRVNKVEGEAKTWGGDPPTIAANKGAIYVGWTRRVRSAEGSGTDLMVSVSRDGGTTFDDAVKVNDDTMPASHGMHSLALGKNGEVFAAWLDERALRENKAVHTMHHTGDTEAAEPNSEVYFAVSRDGGRTFSANRKIAGDVCPCCKTSMTVSPEGRLYLSWRQVLPESFRHIAVAVSDDGGKTFSSPVVVSNDQWQLNACPVSGASMAAGTDGKLEVVWYTAGNAGPPGLYKAESINGGKSFEPRSLVSTDAVGGPPILLNAGNGAAIYIFSASDGRVVLAASDKPLVGEMSKGNAPAAVLINGKVITVFVRPDGDIRSVRIGAKGIDELLKR